MPTAREDRSDFAAMFRGNPGVESQDKKEWTLQVGSQAVSVTWRKTSPTSALLRVAVGKEIKLASVRSGDVSQIFSHTEINDLRAIFFWLKGLK